MFDNFITSPFVFFPVYYIAREIIQGEGSRDSNPTFEKITSMAMTEYQKNMKDDLVGFSISSFSKTILFILFEATLCISYLTAASFCTWIAHLKLVWFSQKSLWAMWIPGQAFTFSLPLWARLPAAQFISFFYICILSYMRGDVARDSDDGGNGVEQVVFESNHEN